MAEAEINIEQIFPQKLFLLPKASGKLIDCQTYTENMARYGAREITKKQYLAKLGKYSKIPLKSEIENLFDYQKSSSSTLVRS